MTVTSADGSREKSYRVRLGAEEVAEPAAEEVAEPTPEEAAGPAADCLRGDIAVGFSLVVYAGGSIEDLVACAESRNVTALYALDGGGVRLLHHRSARVGERGLRGALRRRACPRVRR